MKAITCQVASLTPLTEYVYKALLKPSQAIDFAAGQYLNFVMSCLLYTSDAADE